MFISEAERSQQISNAEWMRRQQAQQARQAVMSPELDAIDQAIEANQREYDSEVAEHYRQIDALTRAYRARHDELVRRRSQLSR